APLASAQTRTLRVVTYNIEADINGVTTPRPGLIAPPSAPSNVQAGGVLEGIGEEMVGNDPAQPLDILALQETTSNPITISPIVNGLNSFYNSPGMYTNSNYQASESGGDVADGNGPNALVYNTKTVQLIASVPVDPPGGAGYLGSSSGEYREVMRYEFAPAGMVPTAANEFYIYASHYKSGTSSSDLTYRNGEAQIIRNDEANNLPANARVIYAGDFNITTSGEASYQTILAAKAPNGIQQGQGIDPMNATGSTGINWGTYTTATNILAMESESATDLRYRDDLQVLTTNVYYGMPSGLSYVPETYHVFGNNGTTPYYGTVNSGSNTALNNNLAPGSTISAAQLYLDLTDASDHLPMVADYTILLPAPLITDVSTDGTNLFLDVANAITNGVFTVLTSTSPTLSLTNWTAVATNVASSDHFVFTVTNALSQTTPIQLFIIEEN
ncbi:MAG TPA: endonuclease/exonuclease/phosphatase family protein, partial [Candidatus Saccharimonadales bacterium]|nr:endonuclease/exonuclease/phosphatase family protein [Candidatus Saccharimonadales bacterium]